MSNLQTLDDVVDAFIAYAPASMTGRYSTDRMKTLMNYLGNPQNELKVVHVAGTSGKTSTSYFIRGLLEATGMKTGLTVSPHITNINERLQINGVPLEAPTYIAYANEFLDLIEPFNLQPTYFELLIAMAYWVFAKENVEYAVIETGLGGLSDGTNVVSRADKVCVITDIGLDHIKILGDTIPEIAAHKAGIIMHGNYVFMRLQTSDIMDIIQQTVKAKQATLKIVEQGDMPTVLPVLQYHNWALALATVQYLQTRDGLPVLSNEQQEKVALQTPPGRWEVYYHEDRMIILDGAHNPQKIQALCDSLHAKHLTSAAVLMNYISAPDLKITQSLGAIQPFITHLIIPEFTSGQGVKSRDSVPATTFAQFAKVAGITDIEVEANVARALHLLLNRPEKILLVTGSLYLVSQVRNEIRQLVSADKPQTHTI
jgi:dihydrofolate synthase / folylpolyglutamate synthase